MDRLGCVLVFVFEVLEFLSCTCNAINNKFSSSSRRSFSAKHSRELKITSSYSYYCLCRDRGDIYDGRRFVHVLSSKTYSRSLSIPSTTPELKPGSPRLAFNQDPRTPHRPISRLVHRINPLRFDPHRSIAHRIASLHPAPLR